jgi:hypothetical protein
MSTAKEKPEGHDRPNHMLLVLFRSAEQPEQLRVFFRSAKAFEFGAGAWLVPIAADTDVCLRKIVEHDPSANQGVVVIAVSRIEPPISIHEYPELVEWLQSAREPGQ